MCLALSKCQINATNYDNDYQEVVGFLTNSPKPSGGPDPASRCRPRLEASLPEGDHSCSGREGRD